ncbi:MAG: heat-inducible transcriptional repressor HrcA, partial [Nitrospiria bacterium]
MGLDERTKNVLKAVVLAYIKTAHPIGSHAIAERPDFGVSSATIRSIMADLEEEGFLSQPHPSAGRVPTEKGYRFYVDTLFQEAAFLKHRDEILQQAEKLVKREDIRMLLQDTSKLLSDLTHYMGIVTAPKFSLARIRHIEFIRLRKNCVMTITVSEEGFIQNKVFEVSKDLPQRELNRISNYLNTIYKGLTLHDVRQKLLRQIRKMKDLYDHLQQEAFELTKQATMDTEMGDGEELYMDGTAYMLDFPDFTDFNIMKGLLSAFEEKRAILQLLERHIDSEGVQVFIGAENRFLGDHHCSLVVSRYKRGDRILGTLG